MALFKSSSPKQEPAAASPAPAKPVSIGRNDPCHCGSGKKYKKCCEAKDEAKEHTVLEKQWTEAEKVFAKEKEKEEEEAKKAPPQPGNLPIKPSANAQVSKQKHNTFVAPKFNMPRKSGGGGA